MGRLFNNVNRGFTGPTVTTEVILLISFPSTVAGFIGPFDISAMSATAPLTSLCGPSTRGIIFSAGSLFFNVGTKYVNRISTFLLVINNLCLITEHVVGPSTPLYFVKAITLYSLVTNRGINCTLFANNLVLKTVFVTASCAAAPADSLNGTVFNMNYNLVAFIVECFNTIPRNISCSVLVVGVLAPCVGHLAREGPFNCIGRNG